MLKTVKGYVFWNQDITVIIFIYSIEALFFEKFMVYSQEEITKYLNLCSTTRSELAGLEGACWNK